MKRIYAKLLPSYLKTYALTTIVALVSVALVNCTQDKKLPTSAMMIRAVSPLGDSFYKPPQPIWRFAITNTGNSVAFWMAGIQVQGGSDIDYSHAGGHIEWPEGVLIPCQGIEINMIVPAKTGSVWHAYIDFWAVSPQNLKKAQSDADRFGLSVNVFCPHPQDKKETYNDDWHH